MDHRIVQTKKKKFIAVVRSFPNAIINDPDSHDIPDFWEECDKGKLISQLVDLRPAGKRDLYGLCSPTKEGNETFEYGIGVLIDEDTSEAELAEMKNAGFRIWDVPSGTYAVFDCIGENGNCISDTWSKFYKEFLPQMGYQAEEETDYERYLENSEGGLFCELWIPISKNI